ncbi:carboxypeptidase B-like [Pectinophora gossypiella]|uniref:carboxypeptidase B-like n=1 Tax=Pectinophora gossypiella TaxID=13191 RepID=UPI00214EDE55|nr:carboxypeptidase B-like [Pectinophora gossypiella]
MWVAGIFLLASVVFAKHEIYEGHAVYQVSVKDVAQVKQLNEISGEVNADIWSHAVPGHPGQILVSRELKDLFEEALRSAGLDYTIEVDNVKTLLDLEDQLLAEAASKSPNRTRSSGLDLDRIYTYEEVDAYLEELAAAYPDVVTLVQGGRSFEGRPIKYLKISTTNFEDRTKPVVFMESLIHAREWVTLPVTLYAIEKLVIDVQEQDLVQDIDWIILPIANPDGYVFTHGANRFWRKNRATGYMINDICVGVDLNRNFDINWSSHSSNIVCSEIFHGRAPYSEPETIVIRDIIREHIDRIELFLDIHSFGSMILYGFGTGILPPNGLILHLVGVQMATAIDAVKMSWNPNYIVGNVAMVLYEASGSAQDYAQGVGVPLSYTYELPGHRFGSGTAAGFLVDPNFIEQAGFETWEGIKAGARFARNNFRRKNDLDAQL